MTEVRREQILEERAEERQRLQNSRQIADLVRQQRSGVPAAEENVSRAAKRKLLWHNSPAFSNNHFNKVNIQLEGQRKRKLTS